MTTRSIPTMQRTGSLRHRWAAAATRLVRLAVHQLLVWDERQRSRRQLMALDRHLRRDIGLGHAEIDRELRRFFWQP